MVSADFSEEVLFSVQFVLSGVSRKVIDSQHLFGFCQVLSGQIKKNPRLCLETLKNKTENLLVVWYKRTGSQKRVAAGQVTFTYTPREPARRAEQLLPPLFLIIIIISC